MFTCICNSIVLLIQSIWSPAYFRLVSLQSQSLGGRTPLGMLNAPVMQISTLHKFGAKCFVKVDNASRSALQPKARAGVYVGRNDISGSHRVLVKNPQRWDIVDAIHVQFHEQELGMPAVLADERRPATVAAPAGSLPGRAPANVAAPTTVSASVPATTQRRDAPPPSVPITATPSPHVSPVPATPKLAASMDKDPLLDDFGDDDDSATIHAMFGAAAVPMSYRAAMQSPDSVQWSAAAKAEADQLIANGTFEAVPVSAVPSDKKLLSTRWVFTHKTELDGSLRYKARLVARGDHQRAGADYGELYAPVVSGTTLRTLLAVAAVQDWEVDHMDAVTAFLNAPMDEELYVRVPEGFDHKPDTVFRLRKAIYGLKQAPRAWNQMLHNWLVAQGLQQSQHDPCLYFIPGKLYVAFWVDDFLVLAPSVNDKNKFKRNISAAFKMKDLGPVARFLGMEIKRDRERRTITLTSTGHIDEMLSVFAMRDSKSVATPLPHRVVLGPRGPNEEALPPRTPYRSLVGSLLYVAMWTRPDIAFAVSQVARFQADPSAYHWTLAKHVLRYLHGTRERGLTFSAASDAGAANVVRGYVDASWGEDLSTRKSQSGYVFTLGNAAISWKSKLQTTVALSSTEAEYLALSTAVQEALFLRNLHADIVPGGAKTITLYEDNQSTIKQAMNLTGSNRTKHVDIRHHFLKQHVANNNVCLQYLPTAQQPADALTKSVDKVKVTLFRQLMLGS